MVDVIAEPDDEYEYLRAVELLAREVDDCARVEGWRSLAPDPLDSTPLQQAVNALARELRSYHFEGDGCDDPAPSLKISGAVVVGPHTDTYEQVCARLGVEPRVEGWAVWHTWNRRGDRRTLVTTRISTTEGLLRNWQRGLEASPTVPDRAQVVSTVRGWVGPCVLSPQRAKYEGLIDHQP